MKIKTRITCIVGGAMISLAVLTVFGWQALRQTTRGLDEIVNGQLPVLINEEIAPLIDRDLLPLFNEETGHLQTLQRSVERMLEADRDIHWTVIAEKEVLAAAEEAQSQAAGKAHVESLRRAEQRMTEAGEGLMTEESRALYKEFQRVFATWKEQTCSVVETAAKPDKLDLARKAGSTGSAPMALNAVRKGIDDLIDAQRRDIQKVWVEIEAHKVRIADQGVRMKHQRGIVAELAGTVQRRATFLTILFLVIAVVTAAGVGVLGYLLSQTILRSLSNTVVLMRDIAGGDLTRSITATRKDEMGVLASHVNEMVASIKTILGRIQGVALQITTAGQEIQIISEAQACGARDQSMAVSETTSAAAELSKSSEQIGENIKTISQMAGHVLSGMEKIKQATDQTNRILTGLNEKSKQIGNITELIDDVADQTNLLAVNASIEAARAGEQGRGFTVVADQIGKLADSTARSTKDITSLVEMIRHEMSNAIVAMEQSLTGVEEEIQLAKESAARSKEIAMSANQQISGSRQIAEAMASIDLTMKQIASGAQRSAEAAGQLTSLADELKVSMTRFKVTEHA